MSKYSTEIVAKVIRKLTKEQEAQIPIYKKKWFDIGSSCEPADRKTAEEAITRLYDLIGWSTPKFLWVDSPAAGCVIRKDYEDMCVAKHYAKEKHGLGNALECPLREILGDKFDDGPLQCADMDIGRSLTICLKNSNKQVRRMLHKTLWNSLWYCLIESFEQSVTDSIAKNFSNVVYNPAWSMVNGQTYAYRLCLHKYCQEILGFRFNERYNVYLNAWDAIVNSIGCWFPYENVCVCCDRPKTIHWELDDVVGNRLHCETGPAVEYRDGYKIYCLHGKLVTSKEIQVKNV